MGHWVGTRFGTCRISDFRDQRGIFEARGFLLDFDCVARTLSSRDGALIYSVVLKRYLEERKLIDGWTIVYDGPILDGLRNMLSICK